MLLENKKVASVGGGPGGLTLARLLQLKGVQVNVYERDVNKDARVQGSPLDLHDRSGLAAIIKAELLEAFRTNFLPGADKKLIMNAKAEVMFSDHDEKMEENFGDAHFRPEIDRGALRKILLDSLQPDTVVWDAHFVSMEKQGEGWLLNFKSGTSAYVDLVVAGDGANSKIRPYLTPIKPFYTGITMLEGAVPDAEKTAPNIGSLIKGGKIMAFGHEQCLLMGTKGSGELGFYASVKVDEQWASTNGLDYSNKTQMLEWFRKEFPAWNKSWEELFEKAMMPFIPRPIYCMPIDQNWEAMPNATLLGDAAHVMPPFAGEGANMAMLDALELSEKLTSAEYATVQQAIASYETNMRKRASEAAQDSIDNGMLMHSPEALEGMLSFFKGH